MSAEERAVDIEERLWKDMSSTLWQHGITSRTVDFQPLIDALLRDAMAQIEPLLIEVESRD